MIIFLLLNDKLNYLWKQICSSYIYFLISVEKIYYVLTTVIMSYQFPVQIVILGWLSLLVSASEIVIGFYSMDLPICDQV